jgi:hypothetical protein
MPTVIFRDDNRTEQARIAKRLEPYPVMEGRPSCCGTVVSQPTRTITRIYHGGLQANQVMIPENPADPFAQYPTVRGGGTDGDIY